VVVREQVATKRGKWSLENILAFRLAGSQLNFFPSKLIKKRELSAAVAATAAKVELMRIGNCT